MPDDPNEPAKVTVSKVLMIVYDPVVEVATGKKLSEQWAGNDPKIWSLPS